MSLENGPLSDFQKQIDAIHEDIITYSDKNTPDSAAKIQEKIDIVVSKWRQLPFADKVQLIPDLEFTIATANNAQKLRVKDSIPSKNKKTQSKLNRIFKFLFDCFYKSSAPIAPEITIAHEFTIAADIQNELDTIKKQKATNPAISDESQPDNSESVNNKPFVDSQAKPLPTSPKIDQFSADMTLMSEQQSLLSLSLEAPEGTVEDQLKKINAYNQEIIQIQEKIKQNENEKDLSFFPMEETFKAAQELHSYFLQIEADILENPTDKNKTEQLTELKKEIKILNKLTIFFLDCSNSLKTLQTNEITINTPNDTEKAKHIFQEIGKSDNQIQKFITNNAKEKYLDQIRSAIKEITDENINKVQIIATELEPLLEQSKPCNELINESQIIQIQLKKLEIISQLLNFHFPAEHSDS